MSTQRSCWTVVGFFLSFLMEWDHPAFTAPVLGNHYPPFCQMQECNKMRTLSTYFFYTLPAIVAQPSLGKIRIIFLWILNWGFWSVLRTRSFKQKKTLFISVNTLFVIFKITWLHYCQANKKTPFTTGNQDPDWNTCYLLCAGTPDQWSVWKVKRNVEEKI